MRKHVLTKSGTSEAVSRDINKNERKTLIIILHYQSYEDTHACLSSLQNIPGESFDIMLINNGMEKNIETYVRTNFPAVKCITLEQNMGFAVANNFGLHASLQDGYQFSLLLNNDVVVDRHFLGILTSVMETDENVALAGPAIYYFDKRDSLWAIGGWINLWKAHIGGIINIHDNCPPCFDVDYLPGTCILVRNRALDKIGMLPEEYFLGFEEAEFAIKAKKSGYRILACRDSKIYHKVGMSGQWPPKYKYNHARNRFLFIKRNSVRPINHLAPFFLFLILMLKGDYPRRLTWAAFIDYLKSKKIKREDLRRIEEK